MIEEIKTYETLMETVSSTNKMVIDFYASWCKPCKKIMPYYEALSEKYDIIKFVKVNVENLDDMELGMLKISKFPTFVFTKNNLNDGNIEKFRYQGSNQEELEKQIQSYQIN